MITHSFSFSSMRLLAMRAITRCSFLPTATSWWVREGSVMEGDNASTHQHRFKCIFWQIFACCLVQASPCHPIHLNPHQPQTPKASLKHSHSPTSSYPGYSLQIKRYRRYACSTSQSVAVPHLWLQRCS